MKKSYLLGVTALASFGLISMNSMDNSSVENFTKSHLFSNGGQHSLTGAPGENNCTQCHSGSILSGATENNVLFLDGTTPVTGYTPGATYTVTLQLTSSPAKSGFSATALDGSDLKAGSLIGAGIGGTQNFANPSNTRDYVSHTSVSNSAAQWAFSWIAPATDVGDVTFYFASNVTNSNGSTSGDEVYLSQHVIGSTASISEILADKFDFTAGYSTETNQVLLKFSSQSVDKMYFNLVDMTGKSVFTYNIGESMIGENEEKIMLPSDLNNGMYVVNFFVGNNPMSSKIIIAK